MSVAGSRDFFRLLQAKILRSPKPGFDQRFWAAFEQEIKPAAAPFGISWMRYAIPVAASIVVLSVGYFALHRPGDHVSTELLSRQEMLAHLELLDTFEELPVTDDEWSILLSGKELREAS